MQQKQLRSDLVSILPKLRRYAVALCRHTSDADDLVQSAIVQALTYDESALAAERLDIWMYRIIKNLWLNHQRRPSVRNPHQVVDNLFDMVGENGCDLTEARSSLALAHRVFGQMNPEMRETAVLVMVNQLTYQQAATILNTPIGTVMSRVARARIILTEALSGVSERKVRVL
ncbi:MAG: sigma-70 family RNA polymerase sigma factor [Acidocella sp.]|nr:sigma-70 family RNA polymerase sigma factor [Acidocella sp.]